MRKQLFYAILLALLLFMSGCTRPQDICGDGVCSLIEKSRDNCPTDCTAKVPDLSLSVDGVGDKSEARSNINVIYTIDNKGTAPAKYSTTFRTYRVQDGQEYTYSDYTVSTDKYLDPSEKFSDTASFWFGEDGEYRLSVVASVLNDKDANLENNKFSKSILSSSVRFPDILIEQNFGSLNYDFSSSSYDAAFYLGEEAEKPETYNAYYVSDYEKASVLVTQYGSDVTKLFVDKMKSMPDFKMEMIEEKIFYVKSSEYDKNDVQLEVYWVSKEKVVLFYFNSWNYLDDDNLESLALSYIKKYPSSVTSVFLCGNNQCDAETYKISKGESFTKTFSSGVNRKISLTAVDANAGKAFFTIDDESFEAETDKIVSYDGTDIHIQGVGEYNYTDFNVDDSSLTFEFSDELEEGVYLKDPGVSALKKEATAFFERNGVNYTLTVIDFSDKTALVQVRDEAQWIELGTTQLIGGLFLKFSELDLAYVERNVQYALFNFGENYNSCQSDCKPMAVAGGGVSEGSSSSQSFETVPAAQIGAQVASS